MKIVFFVVKILSPFLCSSLFCKRCLFIRLLYLSPVCLFWVCWIRGNFLAGRVCAYVAPLCGVPGRYNFIQALCWSGWRDCTDFPFLWLCCSGYGTVEMVRGGGVRISYCFLQSAVSSLGGWISVVGFFFFISRVSLVDLWCFLAV